MPAVAVAFDTFRVAAQDQAKAMAMPDIPIVVIPHLKAGETPADFCRRAEDAFAGIAAHLQLGRPTLQAVATR
ncbi:MAG: hypothetical protein AB1671_21055 [Thermodesulfobacteriota bacterium]